MSLLPMLNRYRRPNSFSLGLSLLLAFAFSWASSALTLTEGPKVTIEGNSATVTWKTDVVCGSKVSYGSKPESLDKKASGMLGQNHSVRIEGLTPGTTYHFAVASAREQLGTGSFFLGGTEPTSTSNSSAQAPTSAPSPQPPTATSNTSNSGFRLLPKIKLPGFLGGKSSGTAEPKPGALPTPPPTRVTWGYLGSLQDHYDRHGADFKSKSPDDYAAQAWLFLQRAKRDALPMKIDADGTVRVWDGKTGSFAAYNSDGTAKTYFKPGNPSYWQRQPGRPVKPAEAFSRSR